MSGGCPGDPQPRKQEQPWGQWNVERGRGAGGQGCPPSSHHPSLCSSGSETMTHHSRSPAGAWCWCLPVASTPAMTLRWAPASSGCHSHISACLGLAPHWYCLQVSTSCSSHRAPVSPRPQECSSPVFVQSSIPFCTLSLVPVLIPVPIPVPIPVSSSSSFSSPPLFPSLFLLQPPFSSLSPFPFLSLSLFLSPSCPYSCPCIYYYPHPYPCLCPHRCPHPCPWCHSGLSHGHPGVALQIFRLEIEVMDRHGHNCSGAVRVEVLPSHRPRVTFP